MIKIQQLSTRLGTMLCGISLACFFHIYIASMPYIGFGFWPQSETGIFTLHFMGALSSVGLVLILLSSKIPSRLFLNPLVLTLLFLATWSFIAAFFHDLPLRNILGSVRIGEGALWYLDLFSLSLACLYLLYFKLWRRALIGSLILSFLATYAMLANYNIERNMLAPLYYADFLAFHIIAIFGLILYFFPLQRRSAKLWLALIYIIFNALMYFTFNRVGFAYTLIGSLFFILLWSFAPLQYTHKDLLSKLSIIAIAPLVLILFALFAVLNPSSSYYDFYQTVQLNVISRIYLIEVVYQPLVQNPSALLTGLGWGSYVEYLSQYLPVWLDFTRVSSQWDGILTDHFHTHNIFVEALYSTGIVAAVLVFLYCFGVYIYAPKARKFAAAIYAGGLVSIGSFWFIVASNLPFIVFTSSILTRSKRLKIRFMSHQTFRFVVIFILLACLGLQLTGGYVGYKTALNTNRFEANSIEASAIHNDCPMIYDDFGAGGFHLSKLISDRARFIFGLAESDASIFENISKEELIHRHMLEFNHLFCQGVKYKEQYPSSKRLDLATLISRGELLIALADYLKPDEADYYYDGWKNELINWLKNVPQRSDLAVPYLLWHVGEGRDHEVLEIAELIYKNEPSDPIGLWFKGLLALENSNDVNHGLIMMKNALEQGIEKFMPIDGALKLLLQTHSSQP